MLIINEIYSGGGEDSKKLSFIIVIDGFFYYLWLSDYIARFVDMRKKVIFALTTVMLFLFVGGGRLSLNCAAQTAAVKTNIVSDALLNPNLGIELGLGKRFSLDISGEFNAWTLKGKDGSYSAESLRRWKHWYVQPELRRWLCDRFQGRFVGLHVHAGQYNIGGINIKADILGTDWSRLADKRFQGWFYGFGFGYGYAYALNKHLNLEGEIGVGYSYTAYDEFKCSGCGKLMMRAVPHHYVGITKAVVSLVYLF